MARRKGWGRKTRGGGGHKAKPAKKAGRPGHAAAKPERHPKKTRATSIHQDARSRLEQRERELERLLASKSKRISDARRSEIRAELESLQKHREWLRNDPRGSAPVGSVAGNAPIDLDVYRGSSASWAEVRFFNDGSQLLGYIEGRPDVQTVLKVQPRSSPPEPREVPDEVSKRIRESRMVKHAGEEYRESLIEYLEYLWDVLDYDGGLVEFEIEYESAES